MYLLSCAAGAWCSPKPSLVLGHCYGPRRVYYRNTSTSAKSANITALSGRNIKLPTACATSAAPKLLSELFRIAQRADSPAAILGIGTSNPLNCLPQDEYADWYFRVTKSEHLEELKERMKRICDKSEIKKRYFHHSEDLILHHPEFLGDMIPSIDIRLDIPKTEHIVSLKLSRNGMGYHLSNELPMLVADACRPLSLSGDWNDVFWVVHPGGRAILDAFEEGLKPKQGKLSASRQVLSEYGNLIGVGNIFVPDEIRRRHHDNHGDDGLMRTCCVRGTEWMVASQCDE